MESILLTIKSMLGIDAEYGGYDVPVISAINNAIFTLQQIGIGPTPTVYISGHDEVWSTLFDGVADLEGIKSYIYLKVRLEFDPPSTSFGISAIENQIRQMEWRLKVQVDPDYVSEG